VSPKTGVAPQRREQIVRATIRCLAREGYSGLTMKKVSWEAGVSQGILHYYFADKRAILVAALEAVMNDLDARVRAAQTRTRPDPPARLRALIEASLRTALEAREVWVVFVEFWGEMMHDDRLRTINAALYSRMRRLIGALIRHGTDRKDFRPVKPTHAAAVILGLLDGIALQLTFDSDAFDVQTATRFCHEALGRYLAR
jgi:AcrR family transcriptional regulator